MSSIIQGPVFVVVVLLAVVGGTGIGGEQLRTQEPAPEETPAPASTATPSDEPPAAAPPPDEPPSITVHLTENRFRPARITIAAGTSVVWQNDEADPTVEHNVIARDYRWASDNFLPGESFARLFDTPGTYRYFCDLHGGMVGQVVVE